MDVLLKFRCLPRVIFCPRACYQFHEYTLCVSLGILLAKHDSESFLKYLLSPVSCFSVFTKIAFSTYWQKSLIPHKPKMGMLRKTQHTYGVVTITEHRALPHSLHPREAKLSPGTALQGKAEWEAKFCMLSLPLCGFPGAQARRRFRELVRECQMER